MPKDNMFRNLTALDMVTLLESILAEIESELRGLE